MVETGDDGLSLEKAAKDLGVGTGYLRYRFPDQSRKISECYKRGVLRRAEESFRRKAQAIYDTIQEMHEKGVYPSKSMVFSKAIGVTPADGRNLKLAEIWRVTLLGLA